MAYGNFTYRTGCKPIYAVVEYASPPVSYGCGKLDGPPSAIVVAEFVSSFDTSILAFIGETTPLPNSTNAKTSRPPTRCSDKSSKSDPLVVVTAIVGHVVCSPLQPSVNSTLSTNTRTSL